MLRRLIRKLDAWRCERRYRRRWKKWMRFLESGAIR
jgi:hypothetical protein